MRRIVSVWLIDFAIAVWSKTPGRTPPPDGVPFALVEHGRHGLTLRALNPAARAAGLRRDQRHADARAIVPHLLSAPAEPEAEAKALRQLGGWCARWSPSVALDPSPGGLEGLFLDMTGGAHLFGGEAALLADIRRRLARAGIRSRLGLADTPGAAWAVARYGGEREAIVEPGEQRDALGVLPIAALRVDHDTLRRAHRFGLKTIGSLQAMPRSGLARRFRDGDALGLVRRLDQAMGLEPEPLEFQQPPPRWLAREVYAEPILDMAGIEARLPGLSASLAAQLHDGGVGARALTLAAFRTDGRTETLQVRLGLPSRNIAVWQRLFREKGLDHIDPGFGIDALALAADQAETLPNGQCELEGTFDTGEALSSLVDRLVARLGDKAVLRPMPVASWLPERSIRWTPAQGAEAQPLPEPPNQRPILLLDPPEPVEASFIDVPEGAPQRFTWRRATRRVVRAEGPERISAEWWRGTRRINLKTPFALSLSEPVLSGRRRRAAEGGRSSLSALEERTGLRQAQPKRDFGTETSELRTRDYYRVEDDQGARYWLYREGLYGREAGAPSWWMHGLFP